ncbi:DUF1697 domain-containing protein [Solirubrobacter soli]|uniref:DUF1697 domain-containing protein n=1 Tax=Solirubrobacter soli TaxID=363832 RepID=UPI0004129429|nr:DUF1697 domain-containing protein [Solirubrobacter soli]
MARLVALLRGINLGAKRRVPMADLRDLMEELGFTDVKTVLQSGNVIFTGAKKDARKTLQDALEQRFGFEIEVVIRTMDELRKVSEHDPFKAQADDLKRSFVIFTEGKLSVPEDDWSPDELHVHGRELYAWCPDGMQGSRLMKALGKPGLADVATFRNMATVTKLLD